MLEQNSQAGVSDLHNSHMTLGDVRGTDRQFSIHCFVNETNDPYLTEHGRMKIYKHVYGDLILIGTHDLLALDRSKNPCAPPLPRSITGYIYLPSLY